MGLFLERVWSNVFENDLAHYLITVTDKYIDAV